MSRARAASDLSDPDYRPHHGIRTPSAGVASRLFAVTTGRSHIVLSGLEACVLRVLDHDPTVVEIRDQYPLDLETTLAIARGLDVRHPHERVKAKMRPKVMTTDFRVTRLQGGLRVEEALAVKPSARMEKRRTREKLQIEGLYWQETSVRWRIITEGALSDDQLHNLRWVQGMAGSEGLPFTEREVAALTRPLERWLRKQSEVPLIRALDEFSRRHGRSRRDWIALVRHALATAKWDIDWSVKIHPLYTPISFRGEAA